MATDPEPVTPPHLEVPPPQWTHEDRDRAFARGDYEKLIQADRAGQLRDVRAADAERHKNVKTIRLGDER